MSRENVEFARSVLARWNAGERRFSDEDIHPEAVLVSRILGESVRGRAGVRRYLREIDEQFDQWNLVVEDWRDAGDSVRRAGPSPSPRQAERRCLRSTGRNPL